MNRLAYLLSLICILAFSSCEEDKVYYHTAAKADFTIGENMYELGQTAVFKDASIPDEGSRIVAWLWEFGDTKKNISTEQNPTFVYPTDGTFTIKLTVTDDNGLSATAKKDLTILDPAKAINVMWQKEMGGPIESTVSPALSADGKTVYMITDQTSTGAFDVKLYAYDTENGTQKWAFDVTANMNELNPGGGASMVYASPAVGPNGDVYIVVRDLKPATAEHPRALFLFAVGSNGSRKWAYKATDSNLYAVPPAIDASGNIYFGHRGKKLIVLSPTGDVVKEIIRNDPESEAPIMMITANNGFIEQSERYAFNNAGESLKKYILLKKGELAYNHGASKLRPYGSCFALTTAENARIPFVYHCFSAENQNAEFMSIELNGAEIENQLRKIVSSGARMDGLLNISFDEYTSVSVLLPGTEEQDRIADFFRHLDNLITLHQRECISFTGRADRLILTANKKRTTSSWEQRKLSEMCGTFEYGLNAAAKEFDGKNKYIRITDIDDASREFLLSDLSSPAICLDGMSKYLLSSGDIVFARTGASVGKTYIYRENDGIVYFAGFLIRAKVNQDNDAEFVFQSTLSPSYEKYIRITSQRSGQPGVNAQEYGEYDLYAPSKEEQQRIGHFLRGIDNLIALHQRELEKLQNIKKSMLEKMFV